MGEYKDYWDSVHTKFYVPKNVIYGNWLNNYKTLIDKSKDFVIDLGCGVESKIEWLRRNGNKVLATDYSDVAIETAKEEFLQDIIDGNLKLMCFDMVEKFPLPDNFTDIIIADLSLHYFSKQDTIRISQEIQRVLKLNGSLLFRVDSTNDKYFNPVTENIIEKNYIFSKGYKKRYFDINDIEFFFKDFSVEDLCEEKISIYNGEKTLFRGHVRSLKK